uniref:hypothetical protein n=1 Tax=Bacteroides fragilis TaxID=817 RepID=UPI001E3F3050|nr:hypothetical protein [Bacteroides fragilis]
MNSNTPLSEAAVWSLPFGRGGIDKVPLCKVIMGDEGKVANLTPIVYASQHSIYPRLWVSLSPYKDNLMGEKCPRIWGKNYQVGRK